MHKKMSNMDPNQITRSTYDHEANAQRVTIMSTEISLEGSSQVHTETDGIVNCTGFEYVCLFGTGTVSISCEDDGSDMHVLPLTMLEPKLICARTIKIVGTGKIVIQSI